MLQFFSNSAFPIGRISVWPNPEVVLERSHVVTIQIVSVCSCSTFLVGVLSGVGMCLSKGICNTQGPVTSPHVLIDQELVLQNLTYCAGVSKWAALVLVPRMLRNVIKLEVWPRARRSCELWLGLGLRKKTGSTPGWKMQTVYVQLCCCGLFFLNWGKWSWSQESKIVLITESGCDVHSICLHLASLPLENFISDLSLH